MCIECYPPPQKKRIRKKKIYLRNYDQKRKAKKEENRQYCTRQYNTSAML